MEKLRQAASIVTQPIGEFYCRKALGITPEFSILNPTALTLLYVNSWSHVLCHRSIIDGYPLPTPGQPAILTGNHRDEGDTAKIFIAAQRSQRLTRAVIKRSLVEKGFRESDAFLKSIEAENSLEYSPINAFVLRRIGTAPIDRERPGRYFLEETDRILLASQLLGIFNQGHRYEDGTLKYLQTGAAVVARRNPNILIFPFASSGEPDGPDKLTILKPFTCAQLEAGYGRKLSAGEITIIIADRIAEELPYGPKNAWFGGGRELELQRLNVSPKAILTPLKSPV